MERLYCLAVMSDIEVPLKIKFANVLRRIDMVCDRQVDEDPEWRISAEVAVRTIKEIVRDELPKLYVAQVDGFWAKFWKKLKGLDR